MSNETLHGGSKYNVVYEQSSAEIYDEWARDGYDETVGANSVAVLSVASVLKRLVDGKSSCHVLDAGCGTGRVAEACREAVGDGIALTFDGLDYSPGMLEVAEKKGMYQRLMQADLTRALELEDGAYGAVVCCGTFLQGHVGPEALPELCRVLSTGGVMAFSVRPTFFEAHKDKWLSTLELHGMCDVTVAMLPYSAGAADKGSSPMLAPFVSCRKP